jgi:hypothetical protein
MTMRRLQSAVLLAVAVLIASAGAAETVDRIVVVVDKGIILASEWEQSVRYEALLEGKDLRSVTAEERTHTLDRLIDQELLRQQIATTTYQAASAEEVGAKVSDVRRQLLPGADDATWRATLARYGLDEEDVRERVATQLDILRFIEARFRPSIRIDRRTVEAYYKNSYVPQMQARGAQPPPLAQAGAGIEEILVQQRIDDLLNAYLKNLRAQVRIRRMDETQSEAQGAKEAEAR